MKKIFMLMCMIAYVIMASAQKVDVNTDEFTGDKVIKTSWEKIYSGGMTGKYQTRLQIQSVNGTQFLVFRVFTDCVTSISKDAQVMIKTSSGVSNLMFANTPFLSQGHGHQARLIIN